MCLHPGLDCETSYSDIWGKGGVLELYEAISKSAVEVASKADNGGLCRPPSS